MIILKLTGGLGNQIFQYAYARFIQEMYNEPLFFDTTAYKKYKIRNFSLFNLNISKEIQDIQFSGLNKYDFVRLKIHQKIYRAYQRFYKLTFERDATGERNFLKYSRKGLYFTFDRQYYSSIKVDKRIKCIYGYFQSERYFENIKNEIKTELKVITKPSEKAQFYLNEILSSNAIGVSIRCGEDYINSHLNVCSKEYYYKGMEIIASKVKNPVFYIFSDNINVVKEFYNFKYPVKFIDNLPDYESLRLLYSCKHFVIANSSFSWAGAYLSDNEQKIIVAPSKWYKNSLRNPDIYLKSMILVEV
ncbi:alpha-1,2-fucosyltransferase [Paenibacillus rhizophilus]|uniref:Alpha-1,2-fucosyltransferase n=1 Tax=Paenibacillus rhizophilus TaxID=1850366 RepID=A0A3N9P853_9BACL|nr:alpha-1,2-fucosyltransferase [Paenibacillus rhizophilus]RQW12431.1 alpha-1,2-fucosyltransferase [Paenibacillus rhizophilus]